MRKLLIVLASAAGIASLTSVALAQMVDGEVTKVDEAAGKMTSKHGPLKKFDMDAMTMVFRANDPARLKKVKPGDNIRFEPDKINGQFTVMKIEKKK
ncbi:MAG: copper-binding protein [Rhizobiales bacterium]|nr:copper-binding protein [Hyphomicrobiales bacterium]